MANPYGYPPGTYQGGMMPPAAEAMALSEVASGNQSAPQAAGVGLPTDGAAVGIVSVASRKSVPRVLTIGFPVGGIAAAGGFPPYPPQAGEGCGLVDVTGAALGASADKRLACVIEYGSGSSSQKVYCDWFPGSYNIPPSEFVRVSALAWGTAWAAGAYPCVASVSPGELQNAHVPTVTGIGAMSAGVVRYFAPPACARAVEVEVWSFSQAPKLNLTGGVVATRDYSALVFAPGVSPMPTQPGDTIGLVSDIDASVRLRFYLSL